MALSADRSPLRFLAVTFAATLALPAVAVTLMCLSDARPVGVDAGAGAALPSLSVTDASSIISGPITIARDG